MLTQHHQSQFSLRALFVAVLLACFGFALLAHAGKVSAWEFWIWACLAFAFLGAGVGIVLGSLRQWVAFGAVFGFSVGVVFTFLALNI